MISIDEDPANDGWIHSMRKVSKNRGSNSEIAKGILGEGSFLDLINSLLGLLTHHKLEKEVISASYDGLRLGINTAKLDIGVDELEPDRESLARIGLRARALSDRTMSKARGDLAFNAEKLYQELDAAIESGMAEREALGKIRPRVGKLFTDALKPHELERLVRDQFLVATKEGRRSGWAQGDVKWRQWAIHSDSKTGEDSKRMKGQITGINEPYTDPKTGDKYMIEHIRPNDRCYGIPLFELPETTTRGGLIYAKSTKNDFEKGGVGSGIKGHTTYRDEVNNYRKSIKSMGYTELKASIRNILEDDPNLNKAIRGWYEGKGAMDFLDVLSTMSFGLDKDNSRSKSWKGTELPKDTKLNLTKIYYANQSLLKREYGTDTITLYRGVDGNTKKEFDSNNIGDGINFSCYNVSSWSEDKELGKKFAKMKKGGVVLKMEVPVKHILLSPATETSMYSAEREHVILGKDFKGVIEDFVDEDRDDSRSDIMQKFLNSKVGTYGRDALYVHKHLNSLDDWDKNYYRRQIIRQADKRIQDGLDYVESAKGTDNEKYKDRIDTYKATLDLASKLVNSIRKKPLYTPEINKSIEKLLSLKSEGLTYGGFLMYDVSGSSDYERWLKGAGIHD